jgi:hypothetical protein
VRIATVWMVEGKVREEQEPLPAISMVIDGLSWIRGGDMHRSTEFIGGAKNQIYTY